MSTTQHDAQVFRAWIKGRECRIDSVDKLLRLINGGARIDLIAALSTASVPPQALDTGEVYRHVKRGTVYKVIGEASLQIATSDLVDGSDLVIYRGEDGKLWAREKGEFHDGRFARAALDPQGKDK